MTTIYSVCAVIGGTVLVCQFLLTLIGIGGDDSGDADFDGADAPGDGADGHGSPDHDHPHHGTNWFFGVLTFRTLVAAVTFFGLAGLAAKNNGAGPMPTLVAALAGGSVALFTVHWLMKSLSKLRAEGTSSPRDAVGCEGTVYVPIPAGRQGLGKVTVSVRSRTMELQARTAESALPTGARVVVVEVVGDEVVEVEPVRETLGATHV